MATGYITNWGNDANDGLTWETSKKTFQGANDVALGPVYAKGAFFSIPKSFLYHIYGIDLNLNFTENIITTNTPTIYNSILSYIDLMWQGGNSQLYIDNSIIHHVNNINATNTETGSRAIRYKNAVVYKIEIITLQMTDNIINYFSDNTFHNVNLFSLRFRTITTSTYDNNIFSKINNLELSGRVQDIRFSLFINLKLKFVGGTLGVDETDYSYPSGVDDDAKLQNLRDRMAIVYGGLASDYLLGCKYYSRNAPDGQEETEPYASAYKDIFVDADNGDFNLVPFCIAAHMSYDGNYIGARPEGFKFDWSSDWTNLVNINTNGEVLDQSLDASATSAIMDLTHVRQILSFNDLGDRASRNGQQINTESNLGALIAPGVAVMTAGKTYMVDGDVVTVDNAVMTSYDPFVTFIAIDEGGGAGLGFSSTIGNIREVLIDRYDSKSQYKFSKTDPTLASAVTITCYNASSPIYVNVDINGAPILGDADAGYDEATAVLLYARYMQKILLIKADNLPAR